MAKAYSVLETDENTGGIVFAKSNVEARRIGANLFNNGEFGGLSVARRPDLDAYEPTGVPAAVLVEDGWHFECFGCGMRIETSNLEEMGRNAEHVVGFEGRPIYCCHACRASARAMVAGAKAFGEAFCDMLESMVRARFPKIDPCFGEHPRHHYVEAAYPFSVADASVKFSFPGMKIGPASLIYRHVGKYGARIIGPVRPEFVCCTGDVEAFNALTTPEPRD